MHSSTDKHQTLQDFRSATCANETHEVCVVSEAHTIDVPSTIDPLRGARHSARGRADVELLELIAHHVRCVAFQYRLCADGTSFFPYVSDRVSEFFSLTAGEIYANPTRLFDQLRQRDRARMRASIRRSGEKMVRWKQQFQTVQGHPQGRWLLAYALPERQVGGATLWHGTVIDITQRKARDEQVLQMAYYDALTRLPNRRLLSERLNQAIIESRRRASYSALLFLDLDNFKQFNDAHGHAFGDLLLIEAAGQIKRAVRETDTVARLGGDEFVVILRVLHGDKSKACELAEHVAEKIREALAGSQPLTFRNDDGQGITIDQHATASIGVTLFRDHDGSPADILRRADRAMYLAKEAGRNQTGYCEQSA